MSMSPRLQHSFFDNVRILSDVNPFSKSRRRMIDLDESKMGYIPYRIYIIH